MSHERCGRPVAVLLIACVLAGCAVHPRVLRRIVAPETAASLDPRSTWLKAHMKDGRLYVLSGWTVADAERTVSGTGTAYGVDRAPRETGPITIPIDGVALFETNTVQGSSAITPLTVVSGLSAAVTAACLSNTKACFGSCPTFYTGDGEAASLQAEGFSGSVAPSLEASDVDAISFPRAAKGDVEVVMTNEALETHVVRHVHLLAAPRAAGGRVFAASSGGFRHATMLRGPARCHSADGDCLSLLASRDGRERNSRSDGKDLAAREEIELRFEGPLPPDAGIVLGARQTLLSTFLFYQTLAHMGRGSTAWLAEMERGGAGLRDRARGVGRALGGIEVRVRDRSGRWITAGTLDETGPLALDVKVVPLPAGSDARHIRLRLTRGHWRLDFVALAALGANVEPVRLPPVEVRGKGGTVVEAFTNGPLTTLPGDTYRLRYRLPDGPGEHELFLESRGYYLEWIRDEWVAEEDPARVLRLLRNPRRTLRELAPAFRAQEDSMEELFWKSRYALAR